MVMRKFKSFKNVFVFLFRKIEIVQFAQKTRQLFVRLLALVKWANSASKVDKCGVSSFHLTEKLLPVQHKFLEVIVHSWMNSICSRVCKLDHSMKRIFHLYILDFYTFVCTWCTNLKVLILFILFFRKFVIF